MLARLGEQSGVVAKAFRNRAPSRARRSMFGVFTKGCPAAPMSSKRRSSTTIRTMFGRSGAGAPCVIATAMRDDASQKIAPRPLLGSTGADATPVLELRPDGVARDQRDATSAGDGVGRAGNSVPNTRSVRLRQPAQPEPSGAWPPPGL